MSARSVPSISAIALSEFTQRSATAERKIAAGEVPATLARAQLRAWAAIAVLSGAQVYAKAIMDYRRTIVFFKGDGSPGNYNYLKPEEEARSDLALDLCPPDQWRAALGKARDAALARADTPERVERARDLSILARAFDVPLTAASCARPGQPERKAA